MKTLRALASLGSVFALSACMSWPPEGKGGMVEAEPPHTAPAPVTDEARRLDCSLARLAIVAQAARAREQGIGRLTVATQTATRARREIAGRLDADGLRTLAILDGQLASLGADLGVATTSPTVCPA